MEDGLAEVLGALEVRLHHCYCFQLVAVSPAKASTKAEGQTVVTENVAIVPKLLDELLGLAQLHFEFAFNHSAKAASDISPAANASVRTAASTSLA